MDEADLMPENQFRLFAVSVRFPQQLAASGITLEEVQSGVYNIRYLDGSIRLIVVNQLPIEEKNAMLHLFSTRGELLKHGMQHYRQRSSATSTVFYKLIARLSEEGETMSDALAEFA